jgi:REP element-mobilizing transposase RayT
LLLHHFLYISEAQHPSVRPNGRPFLDVLLHYRAQGKYLLHELVVMPDHFHLLITPRESLERAMQLIKGGFSFRAKEIWGSCMRFGSPASMIGGGGMQENFPLFEGTFDRTLESVGWQ